MNYCKELFSLCITCYNHEKYIQEALESVMAQTYNNIEIIICDDFSTDNSWEIIQSFLPKLQKRFNRVIAFKNPYNLGLTPSLNKMFKEVKGSVIYFLSGDDMIAKNYAADIMDACMRYPTASVFLTDGYWVEEKDKYSELNISSLIPFYEQKPDLCKDTLFERLYWHNCIFGPGVSLRREVYEKFGLYDTNIFIEDLEYWLRISRTKETEFYYIDKKDVFYRKNPDSVSSIERSAQFVEKRLAFLNATEQIIDKYGNYVGADEYVRRKWSFLLEKLHFYRMNGLQDQKELLKRELGPFIKKKWTVLGWKQLVRYYHIYVNIVLNR